MSTMTMSEKIPEGPREAVFEVTLTVHTEIYPFTFPPDFEKTVPEDDRQGEAVAALGNAKEAEEAGLESLKAILEGLP